MDTDSTRSNLKRLMVVVIAAWFTMTPLLAGCESVNQGLNDIASSLTPKTPRQAAEMALDQDVPDNRRRGILLISNSAIGGEEVYVKLYREGVRFEQDALAKAACIQALARHGLPADALFIQPHLKHENQQVRREAAKGLQRLHNPVVVPDLIEVLRDEDERAETRSAAANALGQYPQDNVFQGLLSALNARELSINVASEQSLKTLTGKSFGYNKRSWLRWYNLAVKTGDAFAGGKDYYYPTYSRDHTTLEKLTFWSTPKFEQPGQPIGLKPRSQRTTYQDKKKTEGEKPGG